jgi:hypothetical protein
MKDVKEVQDGLIIIDMPEKKVIFESMMGTSDEGMIMDAKLTEYKPLSLFKINTDQGFTGKQLIGIIRRNAQVFKSLDEAKALIKTLQNTVVRFEQVKTDEDDRKGNINKGITEEIKVAKGELAGTLILECPVYENTPDELFEIEIELERQNNDVLYMFYSVGYEDRIKQITKKILTDAVNDHCRTMYPVIERY